MSNSFSDSIKEALARKHEASKPQAKKSKNKAKQNYGDPMVKGAPVRKASGRGG